MSSAPRTVAACVFQGHAAGHDCDECPLVQVLVRRIHDLGIEDSPAHVDREVDKYRALARILACPTLAKVTHSPHDARFAQLPTLRVPLAPALQYDRQSWSRY